MLGTTSVSIFHNEPLTGGDGIEYGSLNMPEGTTLREHLVIPTVISRRSRAKDVTDCPDADEALAGFRIWIESAKLPLRFNPF